MICRLLRTQSPSLFRPFTTSSRAFAAPDLDSLLGGPQVIASKKALYAEKYHDLIRQKAEKLGISVDELHKQAMENLETEKNEKKKQIEAFFKQNREKLGNLPGSGKKDIKQPKKSDSPVKALGDIFQVEKVSALPATTVGQIWTSYHQTKRMLSAFIPVETYTRMTKTASKYPMFVLPIARPEEGKDNKDTPINPAESNNTEMHFVQWGFLPPPTGATPTLPSPTSVLFTTLAQYQLHQAYAQPYLILTHYTDLAESHGIVLMRGEITENVALTPTDAQLLSVRMQLFYNNIGTRESDEKRRELLRVFHEDPEKFDLAELVKYAWEIE